MLRDKKKLRTHLIARRNDLEWSEVERLSRLVMDRLFVIDEFLRGSCVLWYVSFDHEVVTHEMIRRCFTMGKRVVVPRCLKDECGLELCEIFSFDDLELGAFGILEPKNECEVVKVGEVDVVVVPGVGFDCEGHRLGFGGGYYDRLLGGVCGVLSIGLGFAFQVVERVPVEKHDVVVDLVVTDNEVIDCRKGI